MNRLFSVQPSHFFFAIMMSFCYLFLNSQTQAAQKAKIITQDAAVYIKPDFDSEVLFNLEKGDIFEISNKTKGPFFRIRLKKGLLGWIADNDVEVAEKDGVVVKKKIKPDSDLDNEDLSSAKAALETEKDLPNVDELRSRGPVVAIVNFTEETMAATRNELLTMYGFKWLGVTPGGSSLSTETQLLLGFQAPSYYEKATKAKATGFMTLLDYSLQSTIFSDRNKALQFGLGPLARYSSFSLQVDGESFTAVDFNLGLQCNLGIQARVSSFLVRADMRYILEKKGYFALSTALLFEY